MKKHILFVCVLFSSCILFAQEKVDYSDMKKNELTEVINKQNDQLKKLTEDKIAVDARLNKMEVTLSEIKKDAALYKSYLDEINATFLKNNFIKTYTTSYFENTDITPEVTVTDTTRIRGLNAIINSVSLDKDLVQQTKKALDFHDNYVTLLSIRDNVLYLKHDQIKVDEAIKTINELPAIDATNKLSTTKKVMLAALENYKKNTCELKKLLDLKNEAKGDNPIIASQIAAFSKDDRFKDYPYLVEFIKNNSKNKGSSTPVTLGSCDTAADTVINKQ